MLPSRGLSRSRAAQRDELPAAGIIDLSGDGFPAGPSAGLTRPSQRDARRVRFHGSRLHRMDARKRIFERSRPGIGETLRCRDRC